MCTATTSPGDQPAGHRFLIGPLELDDLADLALEGHRGFADTRHVDNARRCGSEAAQFEFVYLGGNRCAALVHLLGQRAGGRVPDEFAGLLDVVQAVFAPDAAETDDRRDVVEGVEEAVGRQFRRPSRSCEEIQPIGRGPTMALNGSWGRPWPLAGS